MLQHPSVGAALTKKAGTVSRLGLDTAFLKQADLAFA